MLEHHAGASCWSNLRKIPGKGECGVMDGGGRGIGEGGDERWGRVEMRDGGGMGSMVVKR